jgi:hypothetical protein
VSARVWVHELFTWEQFELLSLLQSLPLSL